MLEINGRFKIIGLINKNSNFAVYDARDKLKNDYPVVIKATVSDDKFQKDLLQKEFLVSLNYQHPGIRSAVSFHNMRTIDGRFSDAGCVFTVTERMPGLFEITHENEKDMLNMLFAVISFLHKNGTYHGDMRKENILADNKGNPLFLISVLYMSAPKQV